MYPRLVLMRELLADHGSIYVHIDWHVGHYVKILLDEIFGKENLLNEVIRSYNTRTMVSDRYARKHDNLLFYSKSLNKHYFNADSVRVPHTADSLEQYNKIDENGKRYKPQS